MTEATDDEHAGSSSSSSSNPTEPCGDSVFIRTVRDNHRLLEHLVGQVAELHDQLNLAVEARGETADNLDSRGANTSRDEDSEDRIWRLKGEFAEDRADLEARIVELQMEVSELRAQNRELSSADGIAGGRAARPDAANAEAMSWEQRKNLVLQQLEDESFDAASFASSMTQRDRDRNETPQGFVESLHKQLASCNDEISDLRQRLSDQADGRNNLSKAQAAEIKDLIDADELVQRELDRLQHRQAEWAERSREEEIQASLERAKLSRERQQLAQRQSELDEELARLRRESPESLEDGSSKASRRWLVKLGLHEDE